jgi:hypothetical protein
MVKPWFKHFSWDYIHRIDRLAMQGSSTVRFTNKIRENGKMHSLIIQSCLALTIQIMFSF